jgi:signal transduction histidine kinase
LLHSQAVSNVFSTRPEEAKRRLDGAIDQAEQAITEGRDAVQGLRPSTMVSGDFAAALNTLGAELSTVDGNQSPPTLHVEVEGKARELRPVLRDEIYRIAGEGLRNAFHNAQARNVKVGIHYDEQQLTVRVRDDGKGSAPRLSKQKSVLGTTACRGCANGRAKLVRNWSSGAARKPEPKWS